MSLRIEDLAGRRVAILGLGREGWSVRRALAERLAGQSVTLIDEGQFQAPADLAQIIRDDTVLNTALDDQDLTGYDCLVKSPGISAYRPALQAARAAGVTITSASNLWFADKPRTTTLCITGTKGKSTSSALLAHLLAGLGEPVQLAGNIGRPLLDLPEELARFTVVELSSYQCADFEGRADVAVLLNLHQEHLDWHGGLDRYHADKLRLLERADWRLLNHADSRCRAWGLPLDRCGWFNRPEQGFSAGEPGIMRDGVLWMAAQDLPLRGRGNLENCCAVLGVIEQLGLSVEAARAPLQSFRGLPHRQKVLGERHGVLYVDDAIATTPEATLAALQAFRGRPVTLILGGHDRGLSWEGFASAVAPLLPQAIIALPATGPRICELLEARGQVPAGGLHQAENLQQAMNLARSLTPEGGCILLSPGAPSFTEFRDYQARGRAFAHYAGLDATQHNP